MSANEEIRHRELVRRLDRIDDTLRNIAATLTLLVPRCKDSAIDMDSRRRRCVLSADHLGHHEWEVMA